MIEMKGKNRHTGAGNFAPFSWKLMELLNRDSSSIKKDLDTILKQIAWS
jgi:hypothetical protein